MLHEDAHALSQQILDQYEVGDLIKSEIYGPVYQAQHKANQEKVRLHVLVSPDQRSLSLDRFKQSIYSIKGINHSHLAGMHGFGEKGNMLYIAYEDSELTPLSELIPEQGFLQFPERLSEFSTWVTQLLEALQKLHSHRVFHHALSLDSLYVNQDKQLVLTHHGISSIFKRKMQSLATAISLDDPIMCARADYVSPEEIKGRLTNQSSDLYAVTCIIHQLLTGDVPFQSDSPEEVLQMHLEKEYTEHANLLTDWEAFIQKGLMKESRNRFVSAQALQTEFQKIISQQSSVDDLLEVGLNTEFIDEIEEIEDGDESIEAIGLKTNDYDEMAFGFSQNDQDERTFLEFGDIDEQTFFEEHLDEAIEVAHKTGVYDSLEFPKPSEDKLKSIVTHSNKNTRKPVAMNNPPHDSASQESGRPIFVTNAYTSPQEDIMELQDDEGLLEPSVVLPLPNLKNSKSNQASANISPSHSQGSQVSPAKAEHMPPQKSPIGSFVRQGDASEWPEEKPIDQNPSPAAPTPTNSYQNLGINQPQSKKRQAPKLQGTKSKGQKIKTVGVAIVLMLVGAILVTIFNPFVISKQAESITIVTEPSEMSLMINQKRIKDQTPYRHEYSEDVKAQKKVEFRFVWNNSHMLKSKLPLLEGDSWLYLKAKDAKSFNASSMSYVVIQAQNAQATVLHGPKILGETPLILFGVIGEEINVTLRIPGMDQQVKVKFEKSPSKPINVKFDLPTK